MYVKQVQCLYMTSMFAYMYRHTVDGEKIVFIELFVVLKFEAF